MPGSKVNRDTLTLWAKDLNELKDVGDLKKEPAWASHSVASSNMDACDRSWRLQAIPVGLISSRWAAQGCGDVGQLVVTQQGEKQAD
jgi:hypothetical protein